MTRELAGRHLGATMAVAVAALVAAVVTPLRPIALALLLVGAAVLAFVALTAAWEWLMQRLHVLPSTRRRAR